jgi:hypothetical protein
VALLVTLFVDVGNNREVLSDVQLSYSWEALSPSPYDGITANSTQSISGAQLPYFPRLAKFIHDVITHVGTMVASRVEFNRYLCEVLTLLERLVSFGYYANPEVIAELVDPLLDMADGFTDLPYEPTKVTFGDISATRGPSSEVTAFQTKNRFKKNAENKLMVDVKLRALQVLDAIVNFVFTTRLQRFLFDFKTAYEWADDNALKRKRSMYASRKGSKQLPGLQIKSSEMHALRALLHANDDDAVFLHTDAIRQYISSMLRHTDCITPAADPQVCWQKSENFLSFFLFIFRVAQ